VPLWASRRSKDTWQKLSTLTYRGIARVLAQILGRHPAVRSVFVRRSVASGEASFGRSDIDFGIILRTPQGLDQETRWLVSLSGLYQNLRRLIPITGECLVYRPEEFLWYATVEDTYRGSLDRRAARWLFGDRIVLPIVPVRREHAIRRQLFWFESYLMTALRKRHRRNLQKFALEMWNALAVARGLLKEPYLTRREAQEHWRQLPSETHPPALDDPEIAFAACCGLAGRLHAEVFDPLPQLRAPQVFSASLPPDREPRLFVVLPRAGHFLPREAWNSRSLVITPEALELLVHYVNPFAYLAAPEAMRALGIRPPGWEAFLLAVHHFVGGHKLRGPGFSHRDPVRVVRAVALFRHTLPLLELGATPTHLPELEAGCCRAAATVEEFYRRDYAALRQSVIQALRRTSMDTLRSALPECSSL